MLPLIITLSMTCVGLLAGTGVTIARDGGTEPPHPGFGDLPADDPARPLDVGREPECDELDDPDLTAPVVRGIRATADQCLSRPGPDEQLPPATQTTHLTVRPAEIPEPGRHRAPEPAGQVPAELATYPAWVAAGCPMPHSAGWFGAAR